MLLIASIAGAIPGAVGAATNRVKTWDEFLLWVVGGAIGGVLTVVGWTGIILGIRALEERDASVATTATVVLIIFGAAALLGAVAGPLLDATESPVAWLFSFLIQWVQSPLLTTDGLVATLIMTIRRGKVDFRRGMLFIAVGPGGSALTLGAVAWTQSGRFNQDGTVPDSLALHESTHSRTVGSIGELGFTSRTSRSAPSGDRRRVAHGTTSMRPVAAIRSRKRHTLSPVTRLPRSANAAGRVSRAV